MHSAGEELTIDGDTSRHEEGITRARHVSDQAEALLRLRNIAGVVPRQLNNCCDVLPDVKQRFAAAAIQEKNHILLEESCGSLRYSQPKMRWDGSSKPLDCGRRTEQPGHERLEPLYR